MCFDAGSGRVLLHGGVDTLGTTVFGDTWEWDGTSWARMTSERTPIARHGHAMAYDFARRRPMMIGGGDPNLRDDAWFFSPTPFQVVRYGTSCARPAGPLQFAALGAPRVGAGLGAALFALELTGATPTAPLAIALSLQPDARAFGACTQWIGTPFYVMAGTSSVNGFATLPLTLPIDPQLRGIELFAQGLTVDGSALALSAGLRLAIGD